MSPHPDRNDEPAERAPKRRRVAQACTPCRQRKSRCNGARPVCSACAELKHQCSYLGPDDVRHIAVGQGYLKTLEQRLAQLEAAVTTNQPATCVQTDSPARASQTNHERAFDYDSNEGSEPQTTSSRDPTDGMAHFIFAEEEDVGYFGPSSNIYFTRDISNALQRILWIIEAGGGQVASIPHLDRGVLAISRPPSPSARADGTTTGTPGQQLRGTITGPDSRENDAHCLPPEQQVRGLLGKYFANTGELFPYIHPASFMQTYQEVLQERRPVRRTWLALLNIIMAMTISTDISAQDADPLHRQQRAHLFYNRATKLGGGSTATHASLETVQYLLVTSQYLQGTSTSSQTWAMHGLAVKAALQLGLHSTQALRRYPPLEQEMGKRTWFGCVVLDRTLSMTFGRPPTIPESFLKNLQLATPYEMSSEPQLESTRSHYSTGFFNATITLYRILGDAIQLLYGDNLGGDQHQQTYQMLADVLHLEERLETWTRNLPPDMNTTQASPATPDGPYKLGIILRLRYLNTRSLIHRVVISSILRTVGSAESQAHTSPSLDLARKASLEICVSSSLEVISRISYATSEDSPRVKALGAWWFSLYYTVDAALELFAASMICHVHPHMASLTTSSAEDRKGAIQQAIETLGRLDRGNRTVDRCIDCLKRLVQALAQLSTASVNNNGSTNISGGFTPFVSAAPLSPTLWSGNEASATDGQPSFLDLDSLFDNNFLYMNDDSRTKL